MATSTAKLADNYENGVCPDCGEPITDEMVNGAECDNCGHIFYSALDLLIYSETKKN